MNFLRYFDCLNIYGLLTGLLNQSHSDSEIVYQDNSSVYYRNRIVTANGNTFNHYSVTNNYGVPLYSIPIANSCSLCGFGYYPMNQCTECSTWVCNECVSNHACL